MNQERGRLRFGAYVRLFVSLRQYTYDDVCDYVSVIANCIASSYTSPVITVLHKIVDGI
jgi:hypothetical protein